MVPPHQIGRRTLIPQRGVESLAMIEHFAIPEQIALRRSPRRIPLVLGQLAFERRPKAFHGRVIVAAAGTAHAHGHPSPPNQRLIGVTRVTQRVPPPPGRYGDRHSDPSHAV